MDKFREAYQWALNEMPKCKLDAEEAQSELHHRKMLRQGRKRILVQGCTAAAVFVLFCGAGTAAANNYRDGRIELSDNGFTITGELRDGREKKAPKIEMGGAFEGNTISGRAVTEQELEVSVGEDREYDSLSEFLQKETMTVALPDLTLFPVSFTEERIIVYSGDVLIHLSAEEYYFCMRQSDHRDSIAYSSATVYGGENSEERSYVNRQGISYIIFDTLDDAGERESTHAVLSINSRNLTLDFRGFEESVIFEVLDSMDLTVYFEQ